jgi:hypothetical protein
VGRLRDIFEGPFEQGGKDWIYLILALVLSAGVWTLHNLSLKYSVYLSVPVLVECEGIEGYANVASENELVVAKCRATGFDILSCKMLGRSNPRKVKVAASDLIPHSSGAFYLKNKDLQHYASDFFGESAQVEYYVSDTLFFRFARRDYKKVPVEFLATLDLAPQYFLSAPVKVIPDSVLVYADPARLEYIHSIQTRSLRLNQLRENVSGDIKLKVPSSTRLSVESVNYNVSVSRCVELTFDLPLQIKNVPEGKLPTLSTEQVRVIANCLFPLDSGVEQELAAYVDYNDLSSSSAELLVKLVSQPEWMLSYRIEPAVVNCSK